MHLISSRTTFFTKRVFPVIWLGLLAVLVAVNITTGSGPDRVFVLVPFFIGLLGVLVMKKLLFDLVDEVWDAGDELVIKNKGHEVRVPLAGIVNIAYSPLNPQRATLSLRDPTPLGHEIAFIPPTRWIPFARSPVIDELIRRVDAARLAVGKRE